MSMQFVTRMKEMQAQIDEQAKQIAELKGHHMVMVGMINELQQEQADTQSTLTLPRKPK
jgi:hypothetical protein